MKFKRIALLLLAIVMATLPACQKETPPAFSNKMLGLIQRVPTDAVAMGFLNMQQIRSSPLFQLIFTEFTGAPEFAGAWSLAADSLNFRIEEDLHSVFFFLPPEGIQAGAVLPFVALNGRFDPLQFSAAITSKDSSQQWTSESFAGRTIQSLGDRFAFSFPDDSTLILGKPTVVKAWLQNPPDSLRQVPALLQPVKFRSGSWMAVNFENMPWDFIAKQDSGKAAILQKVKQLTISSRWTQDLQIAGELDCATREDARLFLDLLKGAFAGLKLNFSGNRELIDTLNRIRLDQAGNSLIGSVKFRYKDIQKLLAIRDEAIQRLQGRLNSGSH